MSINLHRPPNIPSEFSMVLGGIPLGIKGIIFLTSPFQQTLARRKFATLLKIGRKLKFAQKALLKIRAINKIEN
jgi:hypothetical protein